MKSKSIDINTIKIHSLMISLNEAEFSYLEGLVNFSQRIRKVIKDFKITKEEFCEKMKIPHTKYNAYISGAYNYSLSDFAHFEVMHYKKIMDLEEEKAREEATAIRVKSENL